MKTVSPRFFYTGFSLQLLSYSSLLCPRHRYLGNLNTWPPETHYRCVEAEGCNRDSSVPPTSADGTWSTSQLHGKKPVPLISFEPCASVTDKAAGAEEL